jgi:flagellar hook assembly protein FlgD
MSNVVSTINSGTSPNTSSSSTVATEPSTGQTLTQADFLKIMVAQFTQQDPLSSGDDGGGGSGTSDYVNQLMSMTNLTTLQTMSGQQAQQLAQSLPGENVVVSDDDTQSSGVVTSARVDASSGAVYFTVNGKEYPSADLYSVNEAAAATTTTGSTSSGSTATN